MKKPYLRYAIKVWVTTVLVAPFILLFTLGFVNSARLSYFAESLPILILIIFVGMVLSLPALILFWLLCRKLSLSSIGVRKSKLILSVFGILLIWSTFFLLDSKLFSTADFQKLWWPGSYSLTLPIAIYLFKFS